MDLVGIVLFLHDSDGTLVLFEDGCGLVNLHFADGSG